MITEGGGVKDRKRTGTEEMKFHSMHKMHESINTDFTELKSLHAPVAAPSDLTKGHTYDTKRKIIR